MDESTHSMTNQKKGEQSIVKRPPAVFVFLLVIILSISTYFLLVKSVNIGTQRYFTTIIDFEKNYIEDKNKSTEYNLIKTINFEFSDSEPPVPFSEIVQSQEHIYSGINENNSATVIFSFVQCNAPIKYNIVVTDTEGNEKFYSGGFTFKDINDNVAACIELKPKDSYVLLCEYGGEISGDNNSIYGNVNIYEKNL